MSYHHLTMEAVMEDGMVIQMKNTATINKCWADFTAEAPFAVEDIVCIELPGGIQIPVTTE